jgi:antitoxin HicB
MTVEDYMKLPYSRCFVPEEGSGFGAYVRELHGCYSQGDTIAEAYDNLNTAMCNWLEASLRLGHDIPAPVEIWHEKKLRTPAPPSPS